MFYLIYISSAVCRFGSSELQDILKASCEANAQLEVTGLLLYKNGSFMQMLEGAEKTVRALLEKIVRDPRHYNVLTLQEGINKARQFSNWPMSFRQLDTEPPMKAPNFCDFEGAAFSRGESRNDRGRDLRLLRLFHHMH